MQKDCVDNQMVGRGGFESSCISNDDKTLSGRSRSCDDQIESKSRQSPLLQNGKVDISGSDPDLSKPDQPVSPTTSFAPMHQISTNFADNSHQALHKHNPCIYEIINRWPFLQDRAKLEIMTIVRAAEESKED